MAYRLLAAILAWLALSATAYAQGEQRFALVIGNEAYSGALTKLNRPHEDADKVGSALRATGFAVTPTKDQGRSDILKEVRIFADRLKAAGPEAVGFFYYSGHGASALVGDRRRNYMIPTGTAIETPDDLVAEGIPLDDIIAILQRSKAKAIFIVFDACRSELPWSKGGADPDKAFNAVSAGPGMFIAYATAEGTSAPDDGAFAAALASQLVEPGRTHLAAFDAASRSVGRTRGVDRRPWYSNQIDDDIYFAAGPTLPNATPGLRASIPIGTVSALLDKSPAAFAAAQSGRPVAERTFRDRLQDGTEGPDLVALPTGSFTMGSPANEPGRGSDEGPQRTVTIGRQIAVMKHEVTLAEFRRFVDATGRTIEGNCIADLDGDGQFAQTAEANWLSPGFSQGGAQPVVCVSWDDAKAYAAWLSQQTGESYWLLSEAEWEYAARAGTTSAYSFGGDANAGCGYMNGADATAKQKYTSWTTLSCNDGYLNTVPVASYAANRFGLHDMHGNVWEWVEDCYEDSYAAGQASDGTAFSKNSCSSRVARGGSWVSILPAGLRSANRAVSAPARRENTLGFRLSRTL
jgi:formylglycine-generating enzyme required for sulfatase activity